MLYDGRQEVEWERAAWIAANVKATVSRSAVYADEMNPWRKGKREASASSLDALRSDAAKRLPAKLSEAEKVALWKEYCDAGNE